CDLCRRTRHRCLGIDEDPGCYRKHSRGGRQDRWACRSSNESVGGARRIGSSQYLKVILNQAIHGDHDHLVESSTKEVSRGSIQYLRTNGEASQRRDGNRRIIPLQGRRYVVLPARILKNSSRQYLIMISIEEASLNAEHVRLSIVAISGRCNLRQA